VTAALGVAGVGLLGVRELGEQQDVSAFPGGGEGRDAPGYAAPDDDHVCD